MYGWGHLAQLDSALPSGGKGSRFESWVGRCKIVVLVLYAPKLEAWYSYAVQFNLKYQINEDDLVVTRITNFDDEKERGI